MKLRILSDKFLPQLQQFLPEYVDLQWFDPEAGLPENTAFYDALIVRTVTPINKTTFAALSLNKPLKFIGTASAGIDHIDQAFLDEYKIHFAFAGGCNAHSVGEYVTVLLLWYAEANGLDLGRLPVGIIGAGHTGRSVQALLEALSLPFVLYDPPRQERDPAFVSASRNQVLKCPILTFHTPLNRSGRYPTLHWLNREKLDQHCFELVINTARGGIADEQALLAAHREKKVHHFALDVWEAEPVFWDEAARHAWMSSPHIAGYSLEAKERACRRVARQLVEYFELEEGASNTEPSNVAQVASISPRVNSLTEILRQVHPLADYHRKLKALVGLSDREKSHGFNHLRTTFPLRHEFSRIALPREVWAKFPELEQLGFKLSKWD